MILRHLTAWIGVSFTVLLLMISGCSIQEVSSTDISAITQTLETPTEAFSSTSTTTLTPRPTRTLVRTDTPEMLTQEATPTPDLYEKNIEILLLDSIDTSCEPACWNGIQPSLSTIEDTEEVLKNTFGFSNPTDVVEQGDFYARYPGYFSYGYSWFLNNDNSIIGFSFHADENTEQAAVQAITFLWSGQANEEGYPSFSTIFQSLGQPDDILVDIELGRWLMVYHETGISITIQAIRSQNSTNQETPIYCFKDPISSGTLTITDKFENGLENLTSFQEIEVHDRIVRWNLVGIREVFNLNEAEFLRQALDVNANECLEANN